MNDKELEIILNFVLNNMGNKEMMKLIGLQETAQVYYLKCEKLKAENAKLRECVEFYANYKNDNPDNDWNNDYARQVLKELDEEL